MKILVVNGPNLNMLGIREPSIYGKRDYASLCAFIKEKCAEMKSVEVEFFQSNHEGDIIDKIQTAYGDFDGIVINAGAYTHYSIAIADAMKAVAIPAVEVHISDINSREEFRKVSYIRPVCLTQICGKGFDGYIEAVEYLVKYYNEVKA